MGGASIVMRTGCGEGPPTAAFEVVPVKRLGLGPIDVGRAVALVSSERPDDEVPSPEVPTPCPIIPRAAGGSVACSGSS